MNKRTTEAPEGRNTVGVDLGDKHSYYCIVGGDGSCLEEGKLATTEGGFVSRFSRLPRARVVLEAGTHSPWISRLIERFGHEVVVVNPRKLDLIAQDKKKTDRHDASTLAFLGHIDHDLRLLKTVDHRPEQLQVDLAVIRNRDGLVRARTLLVNQVRGTVKSLGGRLPKCDADAFHKKVLAHVPPALLPAVAVSLKQIASLTEAIKECDATIAELIATRYPEAECLRQVKGVGPVTALTFRLTIADADRFRKSRAVGSYLGLVPSRRQSGQRDPKLSITKAGDRYLRRLLITASHYIIGPFGPDSNLRTFGLRLAAAGDRRRAVVAVARKLAALLHHLWVTGEVYEPLYRRKEVSAAA